MNGECFINKYVGISQYSLLLGLFGALTSIIFPFYFVYSAAGGSAIIIHSNHVSGLIAVFSALNFCVSFFTASFLTSLIFAEKTGECNICLEENSNSSLLILETSLNKDEKKQLNNIKQNTPSNELNELLTALKNKDKICTECLKTINGGLRPISDKTLCPFTKEEVEKMYTLEDDKINHYTTKAYKKYDNNGNVLLPLLNI